MTSSSRSSERGRRAARCGAAALAALLLLCGGCRQKTAPQADPVPARVDRMEGMDVDGAAAAHAQRPQRARAQAPGPARAAGDSRAMPSRFHSFLPGMFR